MALQFLAFPAENNEYNTRHERQSTGIELRQPQTPVAQTKSGLWQYSIWSYEGAEALPPSQPQRVLRRNDILPRYTSYDGPLTFSENEKMELTLNTLPEKRYHRLYRNIRWTWLSVYHRLNLLVILPNILVMIVLGVKHSLLNLPPSTMTTAVAANITLSVLIRQELAINILFEMIGQIPQSWPLRIRRLAAKIYHLGGVHSGAGVAATVWFGLYNVALVRQRQSDPVLRNKTGIFTITIVIDVLLVSILFLAMPVMRRKFHNAFEMVHRFAGWTAVALFWAQFLALADLEWRFESNNSSIFTIIAKSPVFYLLLTVTISLILPWLRLRKVPVQAEHLSEHAIRMHFTYTNLPLCSAPRLSDNPLFEWHAFAGIPEENGTGFSVIISNAGDWTKKIISSPPTSIWVRGIPARGVLHIAPIFRSLVIVATGSGIGPVLSLLYARGITCRILWSTKDPETTYQRNIIEHVMHADKNAVILNTTSMGRPDLIQEAYKMYVSSGAEAVFIISNPKVTRKAVYALESRGVPTFAPIFDS
jgi:hypothetical protein